MEALEVRPWEGLREGTRGRDEVEERREEGCTGLDGSDRWFGDFGFVEFVMESWLRDWVRPLSSSFMAFVDWRRGGTHDEEDIWSGMSAWDTSQTY